jgi:hypothetical protein
MAARLNDERSHAGSLTLDWNKDALPALADAFGSVAALSLIRSLFVTLSDVAISHNLIAVVEKNGADFPCGKEALRIVASHTASIAVRAEKHLITGVVQ